jgi:hypothetical protein
MQTPLNVSIDASVADILRDNSADCDRLRANIAGIEAVSRRIAAKAARAAGHDLNYMLEWRLAGDSIELIPPPTEQTNA